MKLRSFLPRPVVTKVVDIHAVDNVLDATGCAQCVQLSEQFVLAMEAAVRIVLDIIRVVEFVCFDVLVLNPTLTRERPGIPLLRFGTPSPIRTSAIPIFPP